MFKLKLLVISLLFLFGVAKASGKCGEGVKADVGESGYQFRKNKSLKEGLYRTKFSSDIVLLAFFGGNNYDRGFVTKNSSNVEFEISSLLPTEYHKKRSTCITALSLNKTTYYRLDKKLSKSDRDFLWSVPPYLLLEKEVTLGFFGTVGKGTSKRFFPINISNNKYKNDFVKEDKYTWLLRIPKTIESYSWELIDNKNNIVEKDGKDKKYLRNEVISISKVDNIDEGEYRLSVFLDYYKSDEFLIRDFLIYIPHK